MFVRLRICLLRIKLVASNFARRFIVVQGRESHILRNFAPPRSQKSDELASVHVRRPKGNRCESCGGGPVKITVEMCRRKRHARDAPFVEYCVTRGCRIGMCGYRSTPLTYLYKLHSR